MKITFYLSNKNFILQHSFFLKCKRRKSDQNAALFWIFCVKKQLFNEVFTLSKKWKVNLISVDAPQLLSCPRIHQQLTSTKSSPFY